MSGAGDNYTRMRQRAEEAEAEVARLNQLGEMHHGNALEWQRRAEQAEKERDEARAAVERTANNLNAAMAGVLRELEHAKADNAALLEAYRRTWGCVMHDNVVHSPACNASDDALGICTPECPALQVSSLLKADHPGAALLEYVRALEEVLSVACEMDAGDSSTDAWRLLHDACAAVDALKERKL